MVKTDEENFLDIALLEISEKLIALDEPKVRFNSDRIKI
jgi:hypothetical protein